jgi:hypothetical protein
MSRRLKRRGYSVAAIGLAIVCATAGEAIAKQGAFARECALRDAAAVEWIEKQAATKTMPPPLLAEAAFTLLRARNACIHGKVVEAIEFYESVVPVPSPHPPDPANHIPQNPAVLQ